jgi:NADH-quinone oxidoreductase subunit J
MLQQAAFYVLGTVAVLAALLCITRRNAVHAVVYLINALFALAMMFYLLGAPLVAAWEVIIYAGAIMVLFLFIIMMFELEPAGDAPRTPRARWLPVALLSGALLACLVALLIAEPVGAGGKAAAAQPYYASPRVFGEALFSRYALGVEVISFLLLFAAVGAFLVGRRDGPKDRPQGGAK